MTFVPSLIGQHFAFGHGRLSVLMGTLMKQTDLDRFLGAADAPTAKGMLDDVHFIDLAPEAESTDTIIGKALAKAHEASLNLAPGAKRDLLTLPWLAYDVALLSFLLKERKGFVSDAVARPSMDGITAYPVTELELAANGASAPSLPEELRKTIAGILRDEVSPKEIDVRLAKSEAAVKLRIARKHGSALIVRFIRHSIDLTNVRSFLRLEDQTAFGDEYIEGGFMPLASFTGDRVDFANALLTSRYDFAMKSRSTGIEAGEWVELEQAIAHVRQHDLREMWNNVLGAEPVFAYVVTVIDQLKLLRAVMIGKYGNIPPQEMKRVLPPLLTAVHYGS